MKSRPSVFLFITVYFLFSAFACQIPPGGDPAPAPTANPTPSPSSTPSPLPSLSPAPSPSESPSPVPSASPLPHIGILGKWHMDSWNQDLTLSDSAMVFNAGGNEGLTGDILAYDNDQKYFILRWTNHPAYTGKYQKFRWADGMVWTVTVGAEQDTQAAAEADATTKYTDTVHWIVCSDQFDRADTTSPSLGSSEWQVTYAPNNVFISGNRLRFGTANAQQCTVSTASTYDIGSDFSITANFYNQRFIIGLSFPNGHGMYFIPLDDVYYLTYPDSSTPVVNQPYPSSLVADTWYRLEVTKSGSTITTRILEGSTVRYSGTYSFAGSEDFSQARLIMFGGGSAGFGTGDVLIDNFRVMRM